MGILKATYVIMDQIALSKIQGLIKSMYESGQKELVIDRTTLVYQKLQRQGISHLRIMEELLSYGVEYNDITEAILRTEL